MIQAPGYLGDFDTPSEKQRAFLSPSSLTLLIL